MPANYRQFIGLEYEPPHGCYRLVQRVFRDAYGIDLDNYDAGLSGLDMQGRAERLKSCFGAYCEPVDDPQEGDLILINVGGQPRHIGVVIRPGWMLHSYSGGTACIESYRSIHWRNRIENFYRYRG